MSSTITIIGNLTRDPEMRYPANGQSNARLGVAVSRRWLSSAPPSVIERHDMACDVGQIY